MNALTKANINLHAVLRNIQELCRIDKAASQAVLGKNIAVQFNVNGCDPLILAFQNGSCVYSRDDSHKTGRGDIRISFSSPEKFNRLMDGERVLPRVNFWGLTKISFMLNNFAVLTERLEYYLKPKESSILQDRDFFNTSVTFLANTIFFALAEVGNYDEVGREIAKRMPNGVISLEMTEGPAVCVVVADGTLTARIGKSDEPDTRIVFENIAIVRQILTGEDDVHRAADKGLFSVSGEVSMLDLMDKLLPLVGIYLR